MKTLPTWGGKNKFRYRGSVPAGTEIEYGDDFRFKARVGSDSYSTLLKAFAGQEVPIGTIRKTPTTAPPANSVGAWLSKNVSPTALASYVGPILIDEKYARVGSAPDRIQFKPYPN